MSALDDVDFEDFADTSDWQLMIDSAAAYRDEPATPPLDNDSQQDPAPPSKNPGL